MAARISHDSMKPQPFYKSLFSRRPFIYWKDFLRILLAVVLIGVVLSKTNLREIQSLIVGLSWWWLAASLIFYAALTVLKAVQYFSLMGRQVPYRQVLRIVVIQNALTNLVASTAGIASYFALFRMEQNVKLSRSGVVFIITKVGDLFSICLFLLLSSLLVWGSVAVLHEVVLTLLVVIFAAIGIFWTAIFLRQAFVSQVQTLAHWLHLDKISLAQRGLSLLQSLADQDHRTVVHALVTGLSLSMIYMTITMAYSYSLIRAFHVPIDFWAVIFISALMQLISLIPIQAFGGLGVVEFTSVYLYGVFGINQADISATLIGFRILYYLFNLAVLLYLPLDALLHHRSVQPKSM